jgi:putative transposase
VQVMFDVTDHLLREHTMTKGHNRAADIDVKALLERDEDFLRSAVEVLVQAVLEAEMSQAIGAEKGERSPARLGYRSGYYGRSLITRVGMLELRVPQDRQGRFSTQVFGRYQRSEKALVGALAEMYVQGVLPCRATAPQGAIEGSHYRGGRLKLSVARRNRAVQMDNLMKAHSSATD